MQEKLKLKTFLADQRGGVAIVLALSLLPIVFAVGAAVDYSRVAHSKSRISDALDAAVISAARSLADGAKADFKLKREFSDFFFANLEGRMGFSNRVSVVDFKADEAKGKVSASASSQVPMIFMQLIGKRNVRVSTASQVEYKIANGSGMSMFLVLDKSSSMAYKRKIGHLKTAVWKMVEEFRILDPDHKLIRVGAVAYSSFAHLPILPITWGGEEARRFTNRLFAAGGTASSGAVTIAYQQLTDPAEAEAHRSKNGQKHRKVMVFLTDGENNRNGEDEKTLASCTKG